MSFMNKVVLITGASSGIGAATAIYLSELGALLSIHGRNIKNLQKVVDQCKEPKPYMVTGEITNEIDVKNILDFTLKKYGKLDVLINNVGILESGTIENTSLEQYDR
jgi:NADP-dependent 3-hydroxy acid dehydrogenase YdfG